MAQLKVQTTNTNNIWDVKKRYKVNSVVSYNGALYQNTTGKNSTPDTLVDWIEIKAIDNTPSSRTESQRSTATSGTVSINNSKKDIILKHEAGVTASLTIPLPSVPLDNQRVTIMSVGGIVALTITTVVGTIIGTVTALSALGVVTFIWDASQSKWYKI